MISTLGCLGVWLDWPCCCGCGAVCAANAAASPVGLLDVEGCRLDSALSEARICVTSSSRLVASTSEPSKDAVPAVLETEPELLFETVTESLDRCWLMRAGGRGDARLGTSPAEPPATLTAVAPDILSSSSRSGSGRDGEQGMGVCVVGVCVVGVAGVGVGGVGVSIPWMGFEYVKSAGGLKSAGGGGGLVNDDDLLWPWLARRSRSDDRASARTDSGRTASRDNVRPWSEGPCTGDARRDPDAEWSAERGMPRSPAPSTPSRGSMVARSGVHGGSGVAGRWRVCRA